MYLDDFFRSYWWLLFPIGFFVFGAWDRWLAYKRSRDHLELIKQYAVQGKDPPPELLKAAQDPMGGDPAWGGAAPPYPPFGPFAYGGRRAWRRYYRWGPYWQWRAAFMTGAVAAGFWFASEYADIPAADGAFRLVAIIMTFVFVGNLLGAIFSSTFRGR
jgi:hypothetical protein